jgi:hypothetical protein
MSDSTIETAALKLCTNCSYVGTNQRGEWELYRCFAPQNYKGINLVDGHKIYVFTFCKDLRVFHPVSSGTICGELGEWYKEAPPKPAQLVDNTTVGIPKVKIAKGDDLASLLGL